MEQLEHYKKRSVPFLVDTGGVFSAAKGQQPFSVGFRGELPQTPLAPSRIVVLHVIPGQFLQFRKGGAVPKVHLSLKWPKNDSMGALSVQLPFLDIDWSSPSVLTLHTKSGLVKWNPWSEWIKAPFPGNWLPRLSKVESTRFMCRLSESFQPTISRLAMSVQKTVPGLAWIVLEQQDSSWVEIRDVTGGAAEFIESQLG